MNQRRTAKIAQAIKETVSTQILFGLKDPRIQNVTVTEIELSSDFRYAKVLVSILGDEKQQTLCMHGLRSARGFLQSKVGDRLETRYVPILSFELDDSLKRSAATAKLIRDALNDGIRLPEDDLAENDLTENDLDEESEVELSAPETDQKAMDSEPLQSDSQ